MKKHIAIILTVVLVCVFSSVLIIALTQKNDKIRVNEVTHSIFYAPFYIAINNDYFKDEGIDIELVNGGGSHNSMTALLSKEADIALLGPETVVYVERGESTDQPKMFGQLTQCDGSMLIAKTPTDDFQWSDLVDKTIIGGRKGGLPAMTLQYVIEQIASLEIGTGAGQVNLRTDVEFNLTLSTYEVTDAQYCTLFEPLASYAVSENKGHMVASVGTESGRIPYTGFAARESYMEKNSEIIKGFLRAVIKGYDFLSTADLADVVAALKPSFETTPDSQIEAAVITYRTISAWKSAPDMVEEDFNYLQTVMINAGELTQRVDFDQIVTNKYALEVMAELA